MEAVCVKLDEVVDAIHEKVRSHYQTHLPTILELSEKEDIDTNELAFGFLLIATVEETLDYLEHKVGVDLDELDVDELMELELSEGLLA